MEHGTIAADVSGAELLERPELLAARGLEPPAFMRAKLLLAELGLALLPRIRT